MMIDLWMNVKNTKGISEIRNQFFNYFCPFGKALSFTQRSKGRKNFARIAPFEFLCVKSLSN
jgi:hypothetical protein